MEPDKVRAWATDDKGRPVLMTAKAAHVLQLPGGGLKSGEDPDKAIRREVTEETGYRKVEILGRIEPVTVDRDGQPETSIGYRVRVSKPGKPSLTKQERNRGLTPKRFPTAEAALAALTSKAGRYGRAALLRDLALAEALAGQAC
jgi:8-oxo-dGTP pyrophosphatase MutT (NUDIX family)